MSLPPRSRDGEENDDGDEGLSPPPAAKRPRSSCCCDDSQMKLLKEMQSMLWGQNKKLEFMHKKFEFMYKENKELRVQVACLKSDLATLDCRLRLPCAPRMLSDKNCSLSPRLQFLNSCSNDKYSTRKIEADDESPLKIAIYDDNNKIMTREPFSSMRVQIVALHGDFDDDNKGQWSEEYFRSKIVTGRPGREHLLSGKLYFRLQDGVGSLSSAKFQDNSSFVSSKRVKLGVMAADERISERIQEGITGSFAVKDIRGYSIKKNFNPSSRDPVYKLSRIAMNGDRHKLLEQNGISTVEDLLIRYSTDPEGLRKILGRISDQDWDMIINHAQKCNPRPEIYSSCVQERSVTRENEPFSRSSGSYYLKGSCSMQPSPTLQKFADQLDVQVKHQQISSSGVSSENVPSESNLQPNTSYQNVIPHGNEILSDWSMDNNALEGSSSQQTGYLECNTMPDGNGLSHGNSLLEPDPLWKDLERWFQTDVPWGVSGNAVEQNGACSPGSEADSISNRGRSPASEAGSRSCRTLSPSPVRGAGRRRYMRLANSHSNSSVWGAGSTSNASANFTGEGESFP